MLPLLSPSDCPHVPETHPCAAKVAFGRLHFVFYQYPENPQVDPVVFVQPLAVDLEPVAGKKEDHVVRERHECGGDESREQQPGSVRTGSGKAENKVSRLFGSGR